MNYAELGRHCLDAGEIDQAIAAYGAAARQQPSLETWLYLGACMALGQRWGALAHLADHADPSVLFVQKTCQILMDRGAYPTLAAAAEGLPDDRPYHPVAVYYGGVAAVSEGRYRESLDHFDRFKKAMVRRFQDYRGHLNDGAFNLIFRQGTLVEPPAYVQRLEDGSIAMTAPCPVIDLRITAETSGQRALLGCCLNDVYFLRFADSLVRTLGERCSDTALHFHIIGDAGPCLERFEELRRRHGNIRFGLSLELEPLKRHCVYYACDRFLVLPALLDAYRRPVMMLDADALALRDLSELYRQLRGQSPALDFACFDTGRTEPASIYQATLMYFSDRPECRRFLRRLAGFVWSKMDAHPAISWMLDQAALLSVLIWQQENKDGDFTFRSLNAITGGALRDFADSAGTAQEKVGLMGLKAA